MTDRLRALAQGHGRLLFMQLPLAAITIGVFIWRVDIVDGVRGLADIDLRWAIPGVAAFTVSKAIHAFRWRVFLWRRREIAFRHLFTVFLISNVANALMPFRAGDLLRVEIPRRRYDVPRAELAGGVFIVESVLDAVAFAILLVVSLLLLDIPNALRPPLLVASVVGLVLFAATAWFARRDAPLGSDHWGWTRWLPRRLREWIAELLPAFLAGFASLRTGRSALAAVALSVLAWIVEAGVYWVMGQAFGIDLSLAEALLVMIAANLIVSLPLTPWSIGPYEIAVAEVLVLMGASRGEASSYAIGSHLLLQAWIGITGIAAMLALDMRPGDLVAGLHEEDAASVPQEGK